MNLIRRIFNSVGGSFDEVVTKSLVIRDEGGRVRIHAGAAPDNSAVVRLNDHDGKARAAISIAGDDRPGLDLFDSDGHARVTICVGLDGSPVVNLKDAQQNLCASLMVVKGGPVLLLSKPGVGRVKVAVPGRSAAAMSREEQDALLKRVAGTESPGALEDVILDTLGHGPNVIELREENGVLVWGAPNISK